MNYYEEIKEKLIKSEIFDRVKDYSKDRHKVKVYYEIGKLLSEAGKEYGKNIIRTYSEKLMVEVGKKYNERNLRYMRQFYELVGEVKWNTLCSKLSWSHYREVLSLKDEDEIRYYLNESENNNLTQRQLHELIKRDAYNRLSINIKDKIIREQELKVSDLIPNPIIIKSRELKDNISEYALKELILSNLDDFLSQLGPGFTYVGSEYKIKFVDRYNYIDILLYNIKYKCYVVVELKVSELKKEHIGQIEIYMNYINKNLKTLDENNTVGIIICKKDNKYVIEYCSDNRVISRVYELV